MHLKWDITCMRNSLSRILISNIFKYIFLSQTSYPKFKFPYFPIKNGENFSSETKVPFILLHFQIHRFLLSKNSNIRNSNFQISLCQKSSIRHFIQFYFRIFKRISLFSQILSNLPIKKKRSHEVHLTRVGFIVVRILRRFVNVMNDE